nr:hypothetical protein [Tanacetum cinerariifolium]
MLVGLGYVNSKMEYWYKMLDKNALLPLSNNNDVLRFIKYVDKFKLMQLYVVHPVDKRKPLGDNENPETEETFDLFFCYLDLDVGEPSEVPNVGEHNEVPNVGEPNEVPNVADQTEIPNDAEHSDGSEESDDSVDNDFDMDLEDRIEEVEVDMGDFRKYTDENVEWYARLKDYALELQEQNPDTTIKIDVERTCDVTSDTRKFRRIYVCLGALKSGFKAGKRDLLGLDGRFMSGPYPGQILTAVGVDPNRCNTSKMGRSRIRNMEELRRINKEVYDWLKLIPPHHWSGLTSLYVRNMTQRTCSCKKWDLTGIPCKHAVACIWDLASNGQEPGIPESWLSECYWLSTWQEMYRFKINPCNGPGMWMKSPSPITLTPPDYHTHVQLASRQSQTSVTPSAPTVSQSQTFVRPTPPLRPTAPSIRPTAPFLRPTAPFVTPRFTKTTTNRLSPIKKPGGANGKRKNMQE